MKNLYRRQRLFILGAMLLIVGGLAACSSESPTTVPEAPTALPTQAPVTDSEPAAEAPTAEPSQEPTQSPEPDSAATSSPTPVPDPIQAVNPGTDVTQTPEAACADLDHRYFRALRTTVSFGDYGGAGIVAFDVSPETTRLTFLHTSGGAPNITVGEAPIQLDPDTQDNTLAESAALDARVLIVGENAYVRYDGNDPTPDIETGRWVNDEAATESLIRVIQVLQSTPFCNEFAESGEDSSSSRLIFSEVPSAIEGLRRYSREVPYTTENTNLEELWYDRESGALTRFRESIPPIITDDQGNNMFTAVIERVYSDIGVVNPIAIPTFDRDEYSFELEASPAIGTVVGAAQILDAAQYSEMPYAISGGNNDGFFAIDATTGEITVARQFAEGAHSFTLSVTAARADGGSNSVEVEITIGMPT